jgi:transcriptional regulator with XRE-family HTH domain
MPLPAVSQYQVEMDRCYPSSVDKTELGIKLRSIRIDAKLSQPEVARRITVITERNLTYQAVSAWERGVTFPEVENLLAYLQVCGGSLELLPVDLDPLQQQLIRRLAKLLPLLSKDQRDVVGAQVKLWEAQHSSPDGDGTSAKPPVAHLSESA